MGLQPVLALGRALVLMVIPGFSLALGSALVPGFALHYLLVPKVLLKSGTKVGRSNRLECYQNSLLSKFNIQHLLNNRPSQFSIFDP